MKTFTFKQALEVLNTYFKAYTIIRKWDTIRELCIVFKDGTGKTWELLSTGDTYFQTVENYVIIEV